MISFSLLRLFKPFERFSMANVITSGTVLCKMLIAAKDKTPSVSTDQARGMLFCEPQNQLIWALFAFIM